jgi:hypothetical protein
MCLACQATNLPFQTSRVKARLPSLCILFRRENIQHRLISCDLRSQRSYVVFVCDERKVVEDALQGRWDGEEAALLC